MRTTFVHLLFVVAAGCGRDLVTNGDLAVAADLGGPGDAAAASDLSPSGADLGPTAACPVPPVTTIAQQTVFEMQYENYAWGYTCSGWTIDASGKVWSYDLQGTTDKCPSNSDDMYTEAELVAKYGHKRMPGLCSVDEATMLARFAQISPASKGAQSAPTFHCADFGGMSYSAYLFDTTVQKYKRIHLRERGDTWTDNLAPCGGELAEWLQSMCDRKREFCE